MIAKTQATPKHALLILSALSPNRITAVFQLIFQGQTLNLKGPQSEMCRLAEKQPNTIIGAYQ